MLDENCLKYDGPMGDLNERMLIAAGASVNNVERAGKKARKNRREQHYMVRDLITCLALCHNVTPTYPDPENPKVRDFQASSPDEVALVKFADTLGMQLLERD